MRQRLILFLILGVFCVGVTEWNLATRRVNLINKLNDFWLEFCVGNAGDQMHDPAVTVVRIDEGYEPLSIGEEGGGSGELSRLDYATILGFIGKLEPKALAFLPTPTFDENRVLNQTDIVPLQDAALKLPRFTSATTVSNDGEGAAETTAMTYPLLKVEGDPASLLSFTRSLRVPDPQILANSDPAFKTVESARDLVTPRNIRIPLVARSTGGVVPSLVLLASARQLGVPLDQIVVDLSGGRPMVRLGELREIPIAADGTMIVPARAGLRRGMSSQIRTESGALETRHHFTSLTVDELAYTGQKDDEVAKRILADLQSKFASLTENLVVVGFDRAADRRFTTASGEALSETMLPARAIATIQSGRFLDRWPLWARGVAVLALVAVAALLFRLPRRKFLPIALLTAFAGLILAVLLFRFTLSWAPPFLLVSLLGVLVLVGLVIPLRREQAQPGAVD